MTKFAEAGFVTVARAARNRLLVPPAFAPAVACAANWGKSPRRSREMTVARRLMRDRTAPLANFVHVGEEDTPCPSVCCSSDSEARSASAATPPLLSRLWSVWERLPPSGQPTLPRGDLRL